MAGLETKWLDRTPVMVMARHAGTWAIWATFRLLIASGVRNTTRACDSCGRGHNATTTIDLNGVCSHQGLCDTCKEPGF